MRVRSYPVDQIDEGVRACINNSRSLLESANLLIHTSKIEHSFVLYTFAQEEFGKALLFLENKKIAISKGETTITDTETFSKHEKKLAKAEEFDSRIGVKLVDWSTIPETTADDLKNYYTTSREKFKFGSFDEFQHEKEPFSNIDTRLAFLFIDYNEKTKWQTMHFRPNHFELENAFDALRDALFKLESTLTT
jgi:AbiV family abortive infection protein